MDRELWFLYRWMLKKKYSVVGQSNFYQDSNNMFVITVEKNNSGKTPLFLGRDDINANIYETMKEYVKSKNR